MYSTFCSNFKRPFFFRCNACDSLFSTYHSLEHHKELYEHWSDEDYDSLTDEDEDDYEDLYELDEDYIQAALKQQSSSRQNNSYHASSDQGFMPNHEERTILLM